MNVYVLVDHPCEGTIVGVYSTEGLAKARLEAARAKHSDGERRGT